MSEYGVIRRVFLPSFMSDVEFEAAPFQIQFLWVDSSLCSIKVVRVWNKLFKIGKQEFRILTEVRD